jgi:LPS-assembly protein
MFIYQWAIEGRQLKCAFFSWAVLISVLILGLSTSQPLPAQEKTGDQVRTEIPYQDGKTILVSDYQERTSKTHYIAKGHVEITYQDMVMTADEAEYDDATRRGVASGHIRFSRKDEWLSCSKAEFDFSNQTAVFYDAAGYIDHQFSLTGRKVLKTGPDTYRVQEGIVTACQQNRPKWSFSSGKTDVRIDRTVRLHKTIFKVKGIPVFYSPYMVVPLEKKTRSSGFVPFHTGTSTSKGRLFNEGYYQTLGESADLLVYGDYFSLRGLAIGGKFRTRPNPATHFVVEAYGISDKLNQGGVLLTVDGESQLKNDWRAVARVNISSNFTFRQAFADSFRAATVSQEHAIAFLNRNYRSYSTNIAFQRDEVFLPDHSLVLRKIPSLEFLSLGTPLGNSPFTFSFRTSLDGVSRQDSTMETQNLTQRLDFYPRISLRLPALKGFSLFPSIGVRETYYSARLSDDTATGVINKGLHRRYADLHIDLRMPALEKDFASPWLGKFRHIVEPFLTYRWIRGIDNLNEIIRFDEQDAIADTNEVEYGLMNRFFREHKTGSGTTERFQFLSLGLTQKYYFDPTFGGVFREGELNSFYPLDTTTGLYQTGVLRNFGPISAVAQVSPRSGIQYDLRADFDPKLQSWRDESLSTMWYQNKFSLAGTYIKIHAIEPGILAGDHIQGQVGYGSPTHGFSASLTLSYNIQTARLLNSVSRFNYVWDCCGLSAEFNQFDLGARTESRFSFSFTLKGIGSFGNLKRPESLF